MRSKAWAELSRQALGTLSVSIGVALFPQHASEAEALLAKADEALYQAKGAGRDRVVISEMSTGASARAQATSITGEPERS